MRFTAFINREAAGAGGGPWGELIPAVVIPVRARNRLEWVRGEQQLLPQAAQRRGVTLVHSLANTAPVWGSYTRTVTIHDLLHRIAPEAHLGMLSRGMRVLVTAAARRSARVIVDAESTRDDVHRLLGLDPRRVDVVPLGLGARRVSAMPSAVVREMLSEPSRPVVLSVSALRPHKNLVRLIEAIGLIPPERRPVLVIVGYPTDHQAELLDRIGALGLDDNVRVLGWVPSETLEGLYEATDAFVFPSLYEGFGLPVLEAMARGVPVACSGQGSLREVAADAALTFDPRSTPEIAEAIERLLAGGPEVERLRRAGPEQAARFTWAQTARGTIASYQRSLDGGV
jgi:glycosyltransferase involved in cell wall biosynthesis